MKTTHYQFSNTIKNHKTQVESFNALVFETFGFDFSVWDAFGFWNENYIPHVLLDGDTVIANVSVNILEVNIKGESRNCIQIGTVMTRKGYRNQGCISVLMSSIFESYREADCIYLYTDLANFYQRYDFIQVENDQFSIKQGKLNEASLQVLDPKLPEDQALIKAFYTISNPYSQCNAVKNVDLLMFHLLMNEDIRVCYSAGDEMLLLYNETDKILYDVFVKKVTKKLNDIIPFEVDSVDLGFTPLDEVNALRNIALEERIFIRQKKGQRPPLFPHLSKA